MPSLSMVFDLMAIDRASAVFQRVGAAAGAAGVESEAGAAKVEAAGSRIAAGMGIAGAAIAVLSAKMAGDFQQNITKLATTAGESQANLKMVGDGILQMAGQVGIGAEELSKGMYTVESSGIHGAEALNVLKAAAQGARQENADLTKVTDAVTTALHDYSLPASEAANVTSMMVAAVSTGKTTFDELTGSLHSVTPMAAALHIPFADIIGSLAAMTASGMSADQATQDMAQALRSLQSPTRPMIDELAQLGITASNLGAELGTKGLSGVIQEISGAILQHMGPSGQVLLGVFNQSKVAAHDATVMYDNLPPAVQRVAKAYEDGNLTVKQWRDAIKAMPADQQTLAVSWKNMTDNANGFTQALKSGKPDTQEFNAALAKAMGTAPGLAVALQLTGDHAAALNQNIKDIAGSTADASGNIKGWDEVQGNFNQQLAQAGASVESMFISFGQHLLPALTAGFGFINSTVIPGIEHMGSAAGEAAHWFGQLPQPVQDTALALAGLKLATMLGLLPTLGTAVAAVGAAFTGTGVAVAGLRDEMAVQQALMAAEARDAELAAGGLTQLDRALGLTAASGASAAASLTAVQISMRGMDAALAATVIEEDAAAVSTGRFAASLGVLQAQGMAKLATAGQGLLSMLGGPWGVGMLGAAAVTLLVTSAISHGTDVTKGWTEALKQGGDAAAKAATQMDETDKNLNKLNSGATGFGTKLLGLNTIINSSAGSSKDAKQAYQDWYNSLGLVDQKSQDLQNATANLTAVLKTHAAGSLEVREAVDKVRQAEQAQKDAQDLLNKVTKTAAQLAYENADAILAEAHAGEGSKQAFDEFVTTLTQYRATTTHSTSETNSLTNAALSTADAAGRAGAAWGKAAGMSDTSTASQYGQLLALEKVANAMGVDTPASVRTSISALQQSVAQGKLTQQQMDAIAHAVEGIPDNQNINVTADTSQAQGEINSLISQYRHISYTGSAILVNGRVVANAEGNLLEAYANGGMSPMSSSVAQVVKPGTLRVIGDNPVADEAFIPLNKSSRSMKILGEAASRMGMGLMPMAAGGMLGWGDHWSMQQNHPVGFDQGLLSSYGSALTSAAKHVGQSMAAAFTGSGGSAGGNPAMRALGQQIAANMGWASQFAAIDYVFSHESGWNPNAQNPTSTAYGIPQFLNSTWAAYGGKTSSPGMQITDGISYMADRYGSPNGAAAFWQGHHWYDGGGWLQPGVTIAHNDTGKPERIRTAEQESALGGGAITLQLDREAVTDLLDGRIVSFADGVYHRGEYNG